jgi:hypothetical protein
MSRVFCLYVGDHEMQFYDPAPCLCLYLHVLITYIFGIGHGSAKFSQGVNICCGLVRGTQVQKSHLVAQLPSKSKKSTHMMSFIIKIQFKIFTLIALCI